MTPPTLRERMIEIQDTLRPFISHRGDCTFGQSNPDGDYCTCGVRAAITKANKLANEAVEAAALASPESGRQELAARVLDDPGCGALDSALFRELLEIAQPSSPSASPKGTHE